jgi:hypothetical protein
MKGFLYLRIAAISNLVIIFSCICLTLWNTEYFRRLGRMPQYFLVQSITALFALHSIFVLYFLYRFYPDKEPPPTTMVFYRISEVIGWICAAMLFLGTVLLGVSIQRRPYDTGDGVAFFICLTMTVILITQLVGSLRMMENIRKNARQLLENSFT